MKQTLTVLLLVLFLGGCAHARLKQYDSLTGTKILDIQSWVLGTGETEQLVDGYGYSTRDTGLSDNSTELAESISKGAISGMVPMP